MVCIKAGDKGYSFKYNCIRFVVSDLSGKFACYLTNSGKTYYDPFKILSFKEMTNKSFIIGYILHDIYINSMLLKSVYGLEHISGCMYKRAYSFTQDLLNTLNVYLDEHYHGISIEERCRGCGEWLYVFKFNKTWNAKYRKDCITLWKMQGKL